MPHPRFAVCINNSGYAVSLEVRKLYEVVEDAEAEKDHMLRIIDESGDDYLYAAERFVLAPLPDAVHRAVVNAIDAANSARQPPGHLFAAHASRRGSRAPHGQNPACRLAAERPAST